MEKFISMLTTLSIKIYVTASSPDMVAFALNVILQKFYDWCCLNRLIPHPGKTEYMILMRDQFFGPLQAVLLGNSVVTQAKSTRCLSVEIDSDLNWNVRVKELIKSFSQKLNLLRSLFFLPSNFTICYLWVGCMGFLRQIAL